MEGHRAKMAYLFIVVVEFPQVEGMGGQFWEGRAVERHIIEEVMQPSFPTLNVPNHIATRG